MSGVTKDAGPASCAVVASQWAGGAVRENEVLFSVFFVQGVVYIVHVSTCTVSCAEVFRHSRRGVGGLLVVGNGYGTRLRLPGKSVLWLRERLRLSPWG